MSKKINDWIEERLMLEDLPFFKTPDYMYKVNYWLGALVAGSFMYAVISGLLLLLYYEPSTGYTSTISIIDSIPYGSVVLYSHLYAAYAMIILAYTHMFYNYFHGAYKRPRELLWIIGVILLVLTLSASFMGYSLIGDVLAVSAVDVGAGIVSGLGLGFLNPILFGAYDSGDFTRVLALHIILVALIGLFFVLHFFLAESYGMMPSRKVKPKAPAVYTKEEWSKFNAWWPRNFVYMSSLIFLTWGFILAIPNALAYLSGYPTYLNPFLNPHPAPSPSSPAAMSVTAYPPWFFLFLFKIADFTSSYLIMVLIGAIIPLLWFILVPFIDRSAELDPMKRKVAVGVGLVFLTYFIQTTIWGAIAPAVPAKLSQLVLVFLPPPILIGLGLAFIKPRGTSPKSGTSPMISAAIFSALTLLFIGAFSMFSQYPSVLTAGAVIPLGILFALAGTKKVLNADQPSNSLPSTVTSIDVNKVNTKVKLAEIMIAILLIVSIALVAALWTIPPTGFLSNLFGIDLGIVFIMLGEAISLYHYVVYVAGKQSSTS
ncbi:proton pump complex cytochrome B SoxC [Acidianus sp. RZ1]|uniref:proton pump complex cytochrome B SoxC n=1 Tax=Acidianus sp. RZ1 TaxID=1540082 RepID=UPI00149271DB|nr:cytochrome bc complex cytochrome b subunit [Acidianus sp. RZ1]